MIKVLNARLADTFKLEIDFSDHTQGVFDAGAYLSTRSGPLVDALREPACFERFFIDAGALCLDKLGRSSARRPKESPWDMSEYIPTYNFSIDFANSISGRSKPSVKRS